MAPAFAPSSFLGVRAPAAPYGGNTTALSTRRTRRATTGVTMSDASVLIVNSKGGGHGHIGLHLAEKLLTDGNRVHIHQIGNEQSSQPITQYPRLQQQYPENFSVNYDSSPPSSLPSSSSYTHIYDNNAKSADDIAYATTSTSSIPLFYVSSAGAYKYDANVAPHQVGDAAKGATIDVETIAKPNISFRPIYIIGPHTSKREYIDYFFDRLTRGRPILLPGSGDELTSITDVRDVADLLSRAVSHGSGMSGEVINCCNVRGVSFNGMVSMCAAAAGVDNPVVKYYDAKEMEGKVEGFKVKKAFPFRPRHFFANPLQAQTMLGWVPKFSGTQQGLADSLKTCFEEYVTLGLDKKDVDFSLDEKILANL